MEDVLEARATVTAVDQQRRLVTLRGQDGQEWVVEAGDAVKNLNQIKPGDVVVVTYTEALAWQVKPAGQGAPGVSTKDAITPPVAGGRPGGSVGSSTTVTATITGIDPANGTVTLTGPGGNARTIKVRDPANLKKAKVGDLVEITYSEALAVSVRPAAK
jgi:hypothetical protein